MKNVIRWIGLVALGLASSLPSPAIETTGTLWSVSSFGADDYFQEPSDIAVDRERSLVYVVDAGSARVLVFDLAGRFQRAVGRKGQGPGEFVRPTGVCVLSGGGLAVADIGAGRIGIFDPSGTFLRSVTVADTRVADLVQAGELFYTVPSFGTSGYAVAMGSDAKSQPLVNVLDGSGKKVLEISTGDFPETHPFIRAIKHRVSLTLSPRGRLVLVYFAANFIQIFERTGEKVAEFSRPLPFEPMIPALAGERSPEKGVVQMRAELDFVSPAAAVGPDGKLYVLTVTETLARHRKTDPGMKDPLPMRFDVVDPESRRVLRTVPCDPGVKAFGVLDGGRLVYISEDAEGELALKCVRY
ncbi:MAG: 6-bladed beta-propeller [Acidobacteria bacterium]|jgi:hypothetical protein|nr:6-bladed beta-propeller [Acidobacteriota bacterium]